MGRAIKLPDIHHVAFVLQNCGLVVVYVQVVWRREYGHNGREPSSLRFSIHAIAFIIHQSVMYRD